MRFSAMVLASYMSNQPELPQIIFTGITDAIFTGDSITEGTGPTSYRELLTAEHSWSATSLALSGQGVWYEASQLLTQAAISKSVTVAIMCAGLNDIRRSNIQKTFNKIESCLYTSLCHLFLSSAVASGHASVVRSGTFSGFDATEFGGSYNTGTIPGNVCTQSSATNSTWTYTFTGRGVFVQFISTDGSVARGSCEIRIDGVLIDTITNLDDRYDGMTAMQGNQIAGPDCRVYMGISGGSHTIEVKALSATAVVIDRFGTLDDPDNVGIAFVIEVPKITNYSVPNLDQASDELISQVNILRHSIVHIFRAQGFKIGYIPIMTTSGGLYNVANTTDGIHPDVTGQNQIFQSIDNEIIP